MSEHASVVIAMPIHGHVPPLAVASLVGVVIETEAAGILGGAIFAQGSLIDAARNELVVNAFRANPEMTHVMWIDSDMVLPKDAIIRLVADDKPVVGGLYHTKVEPHSLVAYELEEPFRALEEPPESLQRVRGLGLGCTLVRADVLRDMALKYEDAFWHQLRDNTGEDIFFFDRCVEMGVEAWLDPRVSCGHVRDQAVGTENWSILRGSPRR